MINYFVNERKVSEMEQVEWKYPFIKILVDSHSNFYKSRFALDLT